MQSNIQIESGPLKKTCTFVQRFIIIFLPVFLIQVYSCNDSSSGKLTVAQIQSDFQILRKSLEEDHPGLYWYSSKKEMDHYFDSTYALLDHAMADTGFFRILLPVIAKIRCVHTNIILSKQNIDAIKNLKTFPLILKFIKGRAFIRKDFGDNKNVIPGAEIISINRISIKDIVSKFFNFLPADGYNETYKYSILEGGFFREAYALLIGEPKEFEIEAIMPVTGNKITFTVPSLTWQKVHENIEKENARTIPKKRFSRDV